MIDLDKINAEIKDLSLEQQKIARKLLSLKRDRNNLIKSEQIKWSVLAFQDRIANSIWEWASPHSGASTTLDDIVSQIESIGMKNKTNARKAALSLEQLYRLKQLPKERQIQLARAFVNKRRMR